MDGMILFVGVDYLFVNNDVIDFFFCVKMRREFMQRFGDFNIYKLDIEVERDKMKLRVVRRREVENKNFRGQVGEGRVIQSWLWVFMRRQLKIEGILFCLSSFLFLKFVCEQGIFKVYM